jgi:hypothetical protein
MKVAQVTSWVRDDRGRAVWSVMMASLSRQASVRSSSMCWNLALSLPPLEPSSCVSRSVTR